MKFMKFDKYVDVDGFRILWLSVDESTAEIYDPGKDMISVRPVIFKKDGTVTFRDGKNSVIITNDIVKKLIKKCKTK